jgi:hypothetical protein
MANNNEIIRNIQSSVGYIAKYCQPGPSIFNVVCSLTPAQGMVPIIYNHIQQECQTLPEPAPDGYQQAG